MKNDGQTATALLEEETKDTSYQVDYLVCEKRKTKTN